MKKLSKNRKGTVVISILLTLIIAVSATFAWVTSKATKVNHFENNGYIVSDSVVISEDFEAPTEWKPGMTVDKKVFVTNTGSGPVLVRVAFEEMLKVLGNNGITTYDATSADTAGKHTDYNTNKYIAAKVDASAYKYEGDGAETTAANAQWIKLTNITPPAPTDVTVLKAKNGDAVVAFYEYATGCYQGVQVNGTLNAAGDALTVDSLNYAYFTEGVAAYYSWNKKANVNESSDPDAASWPISYTNDIPADENIGFSQLTVPTYKDIILNYLGLASAASTANAGKWFYSEEDGYFYYLGTLNGGSSTSQLLNSVTLSGSARDSFRKVDYNLSVTVEAVQATADALSDTAGANVGWVVANSTLLGLLKTEYCVAF